MQLLQQAIRCGLMLLGMVICSMFAYCRIHAIPNISTLTNSSPVIVVGEVLRVVRVGDGEIPMPDGKPYACESMTAFIRVDEVLKGELGNGTIQVDYFQNPDSDGGPQTNGLTEGTYLMFFLNPDGEKFAFAAPDQSSMPMSRSRSALPDSSEADVYTQVLWHLGEGLFDEQASSQDRTRTIFVIDCERSPIVPKMFRKALDSPAARSDRAFRFELLAALVRHKDVSIFPELETALFSDHDVALKNARGNMIYALQQIDASASGPILIQALKLPEPEMRVAAAGALGYAPSKDAITALFGSLDDPDAEVRRQVINSLTAIFHEPQCLAQPGHLEDLLRACVEHWKEFAVTQSVTLGR
jgi:hypothetical protein